MLIKVTEQTFHQLIPTLIGDDYKKDIGEKEIYLILYDGHVAGLYVKEEFFISSILIQSTQQTLDEIKKNEAIH
jgi:hypothetical protein